jgi:hypothetical protein
MAANDYTRTVSITPVSTGYTWDTPPSWVTITQQGSTNDWTIRILANAGAARSATLTVRHNNTTTVDTIDVTQAGSAGAPTATPVPNPTATPVPGPTATPVPGPTATPEPFGSYDSINNTLNPVQEGYSATFIVNTTNIAVGVIPTYELVPVSGTFVSADVVGGALSGNMGAIDSNGKSTITITFAQDQTLEGTEEYIFRVTGDNSGQSNTGLPQSQTGRQILDTSTGSPIWNSVVLFDINGTQNTNVQGMNEGFQDNYTAVLTGDSRPIGETIYWQMDFTSYTGILGQSAASAADFVNTSGSFVMGVTDATHNPNGDSNMGVFNIMAIADGTTEGKEGFGVNIYSDAGMTTPITYPNTTTVKITNHGINDTSQGSGGGSGLSPTPLPPTSTPTPTSTSGGGGGGGGCHLAGEIITMANGTTKLIENIEVGDNLLSIDFDGLDGNDDRSWLGWKRTQETLASEYTNTVVTSVRVDVFNKYYNINNGLLKITEEHPVLVKDNSGDIYFKHTRDVVASDWLLNESNEWIDITSIELIETSEFTTYALDVEESDVYFANTVLVHNVEVDLEDGDKGFSEEGFA